MSEMETDSAMQVEKRQERRMFMFITIVLFPLLSVMLVGGYGLLIWVSQMIWGPPTA
ncbi:periplasmic nitrate reductase, NapE protein [Saccharophagus degradans]|uniref:Periplasmic nitrate reductase, NapE protein n=1 Tax=Saccharophagus degradans TaxID=86304 RepID=A0AAW7X8E2_9GAMM|nr:periplasmic nitrate reductase, NapE protein [Saccharophagus degradans]MBU2986761.1 periplasmic nitrate reductase, NapE protein [Saccharophagus degradans]MDO6422758.1 periplasmic nitrate reductase, NapE protein [Saccharophagus degradans]MDO6606231.1 periplasmic nitrate reductase, NapE protein [Saccharophagus degradans]WGO98475.1 periplasmic nitrate reductase, NapE protein [Saccharophagus degradans]